MRDEVLSVIDPVNLALLRDQDRLCEVFWAHENVQSKDIERRALSRFEKGHAVTYKEAQMLLKPWIEESLEAIAALCSSLEMTRWLVLLRGSLTKFLGHFMDGRGFPALTRADRSNVMRMMTLAGIQYGRKEGYFDEKSALEPIDPQVLMSSVPGIRDDEIVALKDLLDLCVVLFLGEKKYRVVGRGAELVLSDEQELELRYTTRLRDSFLLYDIRVNEQLAHHDLLATAGFSGEFGEVIGKQSALFAMGHASRAEWQHAMDAIRELFPNEMNPFNFFPVFVDASRVRELLERMPEATRQRTGGLSPRETLACIYGLSDLGVAEFQSTQSRRWLGCFGLLPLNWDYFRHRLGSYVASHLEDHERAHVPVLVERFLGSFTPRPLTGDGLFQTSWVRRYMTACAALPTLRTDNVVHIDYLFLLQELASWFLSLELDGIGSDTPRGIVFEEWVKNEVARLPATNVGRLIRRIARGIKVKVKAREDFTDVDVAFSHDKWLILIQCKSRIMRDEHLRGETDPVWHRWQGFDNDVKAWDRKMKTLLADGVGSNWQKLNPTLANLVDGCTKVIPVLVTPRPEWIPELSDRFILRRGHFAAQDARSYPVPRICTVGDIERLVLLGGPDPPHNVDWVVQL